MTADYRRAGEIVLATLEITRTPSKDRKLLRSYHDQLTWLVEVGFELETERDRRALIRTT